MIWLGIVIGLLVGTAFGVFMIGLVVAGRDQHGDW